MNKRRIVRRDYSYRQGLYAENLAALILRAKGYRVLARRHKTPVGEIDLILRRGRMLVFTEVKARPDLSTALACVTPAMKNRIIRAAHYYLAQHPDLSGLEMRFDLVVIAPPFSWRHLDNAWQVST